MLVAGLVAGIITCGFIACRAYYKTGYLDGFARGETLAHKAYTATITAVNKALVAAPVSVISAALSSNNPDKVGAILSSFDAQAQRAVDDARARVSEWTV